MKMNISLIIIISVVVCCAIVFVACGSKDIVEGDGGHGAVINNTNEKVKKEITSEELISLTTYFYSSFSDLKAGHSYDFSVSRNEDDKLVISEGAIWKCEVICDDEEILDELNKVIKKYNLAENNGVNKYTKGLPEEFSPISFHAIYASGEKLDFYMDGEPESEWIREIIKIFRDEFINSGIDEDTLIK